MLNDNHEHGGDNMVELRNIDNFILKIEELKIQNPKIMAQLKENIIYIECKVPLFKMDHQTVNVTTDNKSKNKDLNLKNKDVKNQNVSDGLILSILLSKFVNN